MDVSCSIVGGGPSVYISHDPEGYPSLTADERAMRPREGKGREWIMCGRNRTRCRATLNFTALIRPPFSSPLHPRAFVKGAITQISYGARPRGDVET
jgi:hypothetical protein